MKFRVIVKTETYWDYVVSAETEDEARERARVDFDNSRDQLEVDIDVEQVPDDTPEGDVG